MGKIGRQREQRERERKGERGWIPLFQGDEGILVSLGLSGYPWHTVEISKVKSVDAGLNVLDSIREMRRKCQQWTVAGLNVKFCRD